VVNELMASRITSNWRPANTVEPAEGYATVSEACSEGNEDYPARAEEGRRREQARLADARRRIGAAPHHEEEAERQTRDNHPNPASVDRECVGLPSPYRRTGHHKKIGSSG
jgi:hypothetical protein